MMDSSRNFASAPDIRAMPDDGSICLLCAEQNSTCCRTEPYLAPLCFPLSPAEWRRLLPYRHLAVSLTPEDGVRYQEEEEKADTAADALQAVSPWDWELGAMPPAESGAKLSPPPEEGDAICASEPNVPEFVKSVHEMFPRQKKRINELFPAKGRHFTLRIRSDGSCIFLGKEGCRVPRVSRPWYCRIFPAWVIGQSLTLFLLEDCLISHRAKGPAEGVRMLGATPAHIRTLYARLCEDWDLNV